MALTSGVAAKAQKAPVIIYSSMCPTQSDHKMMILYQLATGVTTNGVVKVTTHFECSEFTTYI